MDYQVTVRYGKTKKGYLSLTLAAQDLAAALRSAADAIPEEVVPEADLVELRVAPDFNKTFPDPGDPPSGPTAGEGGEGKDEAARSE